MRRRAVPSILVLVTLSGHARAQACELGRLIPCDARADPVGDRTSLAVDGNLVAVGTPGDDSVDRSDPGCNSGAVYVWRRDGHIWSLEQKLTPFDLPGPPAACNAGFGAAVAIKGNRLVVGAFDYFSLYYDRNAAHVFRRDGTTWVWEDTLVPDSTAIVPRDRYGWAVAIGCDIAIVGAPGPADAGGFERGKAFVFRRAGTDWEEELTGPVQPTAADAFEFGTYLAMDEDRFVGGAARTPGFPWTGAAFVFRHEINAAPTWVQEADLRPTGALTFGYFGYGIAMQGDWIVVGAPASGPMSQNQGAAVVFRHMDNGTATSGDDAWTQTQVLSPATLLPGYEAGAVSLDGRRLAMGAAATGTGAFNTTTGFVYPYLLDDAGVWIEQPRFAPSGGLTGDAFGAVTATSCEMVVASSPQSDFAGTNSGAVYAFDISGASCEDIVTEVPDMTPPAIVCPDELTVLAPKSGPHAAVVTFSVTATDGCDSSPSVMCTPASGSLFPWGTTMVTCTATDASGNQSVCTFSVVVMPTVRERRL